MKDKWTNKELKETDILTDDLIIWTFHKPNERYPIEAIIEAINFCGRLSIILKKFDDKSYYSNGKHKIEDLIKQLEKISKFKAIKKDIKDLDLKIRYQNIQVKKDINKGSKKDIKSRRNKK